MNYKDILPNREIRLKILNACPLPDKMMLQIMYRMRLHSKLDLNHPKTFNEKMQWIKLYDRKPQYTLMVDKLRVREYVEEKLGPHHLIPLYGHWDKYEDIDFDTLPDRFVLKCNHDSGSVKIVHDKCKIKHDEFRVFFDDRLKANPYRYGREWPYKNVKPCIIAEQLMEDTKGKGDLTDYKIHCFSGEPKAIQVISDRFSPDGIKNDYYTLDWENYGLRRGEMHNADYIAPKPEQLPEILECARKLAKGIPFVRTDFYVINGKVYFGEITFFPASGFNPFYPEKWDRIFGDWIKLPIDETY